jgi:hypothetical protein
MKRRAGTTAGRWGRCPQTPGIYRLAAKMAEGKTPGRPQPPRATSATEAALGLRPRRALSSAQFSAEWSNSTSPYNDFSANGTYPLNSVSHSKGSLQGLIRNRWASPQGPAPDAFGGVRETLRLPATRQAMAQIRFTRRAE